MLEGEQYAKATFGGGCFWCTEAVFKPLRGVIAVVPGYAGGKYADPSYREVCDGRSGHAEVIEVTYDAGVVPYEALLEVFWKTHDPTTLNRQGADVGTQYRSVIFYHDDAQRVLAEQYKLALDESGIFDAPIVTELVPFTAFYPAETEHHDYYSRNKTQPYCTFVVRPKVEKMKLLFKERLRG